MSRGRAMTLALATSALAVLASSAALPPGLRVAAAFAALVLLPGLAWVRLLDSEPPGGRVFEPGWALGTGVAWLALLVLATRALHEPFTVLVALGPVVSPLPALALAVRPRVRRTTRAFPAPALLAVLLAASLAALHVGRLGPPLSFYTDSPDHIGTIRRMMTSGDAFPEDAYFRDAGAAGVDPRKGLWHSEVALIARTARVDAETAWGALAACIAPLFVLNAASLAFLIGGASGAALGAWALLLTYGGGLGTPYLREAVFATKLSDQLALATFAAMLLDLEAPSFGARAVAVALALGTVTTHVFGAIEFAIVLAALAIGILIRDRAASPAFRRLSVTAGLAALGCAPYVAWRVLGAGTPSNAIHTETQGLLTLWPGVRVVSFGVLWDWTGRLWLLFPFLWAALARRASRIAMLYLLCASVAVFSLLFVPPLVALLQPRLGYLVMRFTWLLPVSGATAAAILIAAQATREKRVSGVAAIVGLAFLLQAVVLDGVRALARPAEIRAQEAADDVRRWRDGMEAIDRRLPAGSVVLADPATSYAIPMMTRQYVETLVDQHSSPNDSLALTRILDARDALDPHGDWSRTAGVVHRWGVTAVALNGRFGRTPALDYWAPSCDWYFAARRRLDGAPRAFERIYDRDEFTVYRVDGAALDSLQGSGEPREFVTTAQGWHGPFRSTGARKPVVRGLQLVSEVVAAGDTVRGTLWWQAPAPCPPASYHIAVRFDRDLPAGVPRAPSWIEKPWRKLVEQFRHERYRFRGDHLPANGEYGVDAWKADEIVRDRFSVAVPPQAAAGSYTIRVAVLRQPHYPNLDLRDWFHEDDYLSGVPVGTVRVASGPRR